MIDRLLKLAENSYSPYSHFRVATILIMKDGVEIPGVNVENAAYGSSICSERSAILSAISNGYKKGDFKDYIVYVQIVIRLVLVVLLADKLYQNYLIKT